MEIELCLHHHHYHWEDAVGFGGEGDTIGIKVVFGVGVMMDIGRLKIVYWW